MVRVNPLGMTGPAQRLQPADVGANEGLGIATDAVDGSSRPLQMLGRAIDASFTGYVDDVGRGAGLGGAEPATTIIPRPTSSARAASISM